jgi:hypothetical protein
MYFIFSTFIYSLNRTQGIYMQSSILVTDVIGYKLSDQTLIFGSDIFQCVTMMRLALGSLSSLLFNAVKGFTFQR